MPLPNYAATVSRAVTGSTTVSGVVIFDSTGVVFQDVAAAALVYERAEREDVGSSLFFGG